MMRDLKEALSVLKAMCLLGLFMALVYICGKAIVVNSLANLLAYAFGVFFD